MQEGEKCCSHCPGNGLSGSRGSGDAHECCLPRYVRGNLKLSSLKKKSSPLDRERAERLRGKLSNSKYGNERPSSCLERFAMARKCHADNLQHQPLPDRVDDSIFKNVRTTTLGRNDLENVLERHSSNLNVRESIRGSKSSVKRMRVDTLYGPTLGCKTPKTNMDLAICWEAPLDPTYEPPVASRIDGTEAGPAAAIFDLIEKKLTPDQGHRDEGHFSKSPLRAYETKFNYLKNQRHRDDEISRIRNIDDESAESNREKKCSSFGVDAAEELPEDRRDDDLCDDLESFHISKNPKGRSRCEKRQPLHLRHCTSCECRGERDARKPRQRLTQSAYVGTRNTRRNGLPTKVNVPRPRTPYARRSYCIDSLKPPFSIVNGCRDADYPEHWRLTTVYQQSYRNPTKQRGTILNWD